MNIIHGFIFSDNSRLPMCFIVHCLAKKILLHVKFSTAIIIKTWTNSIYFFFFCCVCFFKCFFHVSVSFVVHSFACLPSLLLLLSQLMLRVLKYGRLNGEKNHLHQRDPICKNYYHSLENYKLSLCDGIFSSLACMSPSLVSSFHIFHFCRNYINFKMHAWVWICAVTKYYLIITG